MNSYTLVIKLNSWSDQYSSLRYKSTLLAIIVHEIVQCGYCFKQEALSFWIIPQCRSTVYRCSKRAFIKLQSTSCSHRQLSSTFTVCIWSNRLRNRNCVVSFQTHITIIIWFYNSYMNFIMNMNSSGILGNRGITY